jgi:hypothetical protein
MAALKTSNSDLKKRDIFTQVKLKKAITAKDSAINNLTSKIISSNNKLDSLNNKYTSIIQADNKSKVSKPEIKNIKCKNIHAEIDPGITGFQKAVITKFSDQYCLDENLRSSQLIEENNGLYSWNVFIKNGPFASFENLTIKCLCSNLNN